MSICSSLSDDGNDLTITIQGPFNFSTQQEFRDAYEKVTGSPKTYTINLEETTTLDNSALGLLLMLRDYAGTRSDSVRLINCNENVIGLFSICNFEQLFSIETF